jgi:hypothetical protein
MYFLIHSRLAVQIVLSPIVFIPDMPYLLRFSACSDILPAVHSYNRVGPPWNASCRLLADV